jgi:hypothetical protein
MTLLKYWDVATGAFISLPSIPGPQGVQGPTGPPGAAGAQGPSGSSASLGAWVQVSFGAGWSNYGNSFNPVQYMKDSQGWVFIRGLAQLSGSVAYSSTGPIITTLPSGFRPAAWELFPIVIGGYATYGQGPGRLQVQSDGGVVFTTTAFAATNPWVQLSGIQFLADGG